VAAERHAAEEAAKVRIQLDERQSATERFRADARAAEERATQCAQQLADTQAQVSRGSRKHGG